MLERAAWKGHHLMPKTKTKAFGRQEVMKAEGRLQGTRHCGWVAEPQDSSRNEGDKWDRKARGCRATSELDVVQEGSGDPAAMVSCTSMSQEAVCSLSVQHRAAFRAAGSRPTWLFQHLI